MALRHASATEVVRVLTALEQGKALTIRLPPSARRRAWWRTSAPIAFC